MVCLGGLEGSGFIYWTSSGSSVNLSGSGYLLLSWDTLPKIEPYLGGDLPIKGEGDYSPEFFPPETLI